MKKHFEDYKKTLLKIHNIGQKNTKSQDIKLVLECALGSVRNFIPFYSGTFT